MHHRARPRHSDADSEHHPSANNDDLKKLTQRQTRAQLRRRVALLTWHEIPEWMRDNEYILSGYRREQNSVKGCIHSIYAYLHNETVNIHTHLWGAVLFLFFLATFTAHLEAYPTSTAFDIAGFVIFLAAAVLCLTFSATYHTMTCHSEVTSDWYHPLDYAGIVVLTVGSFFPAIYYAFYCEPHLQAVYLSMISLAGCGAAYIVLSPTYSRPSHRGARTAVFIALGLCAVVPVSHALSTRGYHKLCREMGFNWLVTSGALYIAGALIYANRLPERWRPGRCDLWFASHQIFHVCVVLAALSHYACILAAAHHWHGVLEGTCPTLAVS